MTSAESPLVSIIVPCYNYAEFVRKAVSSVLEQTYRNLELIVVENGSTDNSRTVLQEIAAEFKDDRLVILEIETNEGIVPAWKRGFENSSGEYFGLLPADDYFHPEKIERQVAFLEEHPDIGAVGSHIVQVDQNGDRPRGGHLFEELFNQDNDFNDFKNWILEHQFAQPAALYRTDLCKIAGTPSPGINHICDWEFHMRLIMAGCRFAIMAEPLTYYRWHRSNLSRSGPTQAAPQWAYCFSKYLVPHLKSIGRMEYLPVAVNRFLTQYFPPVTDYPESQQVALLREIFYPSEWGSYLEFKQHVETYEPNGIEDEALGGIMRDAKSMMHRSIRSDDQAKLLSRLKRKLWVRLGRAIGAVEEIRIP